MISSKRGEVNKEDVPLMVSIQCCVYNQEKYIRQCLEGFVMQITNFRFVAIVHDDASTDRTAAIIKEYEEKYPNIIIPIYEKENLYSKRDGSLGRLMDEKCTGKYVALCEGDDYWTDPYKLQKQVDYMESHPNCSIVHSRFSFFYADRNQIIEDTKAHNAILKTFERKNEVLFNILNVEKYRIQTLTVLYRRSSYLRIKEDLYKECNLFMMGDTQLWIRLISEGDIHYMQDNTAVYRVGYESASQTKNLARSLRFALSCEEMRLYYSRIFGINECYFRRRYFKALFKYRMVDDSYISNTQIIALDQRGLYFKLINCRPLMNTLFRIYKMKLCIIK